MPVFKTFHVEINRQSSKKDKKEKNQKKNAVFNSGFQGSSPEIDMVVQIEKESVSGEQHAHEKSIQHIHIIEGKNTVMQAHDQYPIFFYRYQHVGIVVLPYDFYRPIKLSEPLQGFIITEFAR